VLKDVRDAGDALGFVYRTDVGISDERYHRRFIDAPEQGGAGVVKRVLDHLVLQLQVALRMEPGHGEEQHQRQAMDRFGVMHLFSPRRKSE
jgi:hypothetical protein